MRKDVCLSSIFLQTLTQVQMLICMCTCTRLWGSTLSDVHIQTCRTFCLIYSFWKILTPETLSVAQSKNTSGRILFPFKKFPNDFQLMSWGKYCMTRPAFHLIILLYIDINCTAGNQGVYSGNEGYRFKRVCKWHKKKLTLTVYLFINTIRYTEQ